jgi:hypothetical protein
MQNQPIIIEQKIAQYNGLSIKRIDSIVDSQFSTTNAFAKREWFVNEKPAHTFKIEGNTYLCFYDVEASKGGVRQVLKNFIPDVDFHIQHTKELSKIISDKTGKFVLTQHNEDNF